MRLAPTILAMASYDPEGEEATDERREHAEPEELWIGPPPAPPEQEGHRQERQTDSSGPDEPDDRAAESRVHVRSPRLIGWLVPCRSTQRRARGRRWSTRISFERRLLSARTLPAQLSPGGRGGVPRLPKRPPECPRILATPGHHGPSREIGKVAQ